MMGRILSGPSEQFTPITSAKGEAVSANASALTPVNVLPPSSKVILHITGSVEFSRAARSAALSSARSDMVSMTIRSAPLPALTISANISYASSCAILPSGSKSAPVGPMSKATNLPSAARRAISTAAETSSATFLPSPSLTLFAPKVLVYMTSLPACT